ncbi:hypothetical protein BSKO_11798 [Bryopsis sp. KO-2023]|nr:hypothetical protein BSKO_11798 [Bryopsis sp. KO-2023]
MSEQEIVYSDYYNDDEFEYRHVILPKDRVHKVPKDRLLHESEWRGIGVRMSKGWTHYAIHPPELHILLFKRLRNFGKLPVHVQESFMKASEESIKCRNIQQERGKGGWP